MAKSILYSWIPNCSKYTCAFIENGNIDLAGEGADSDWYFLKILDDSLNEHISNYVKEKYKILIEEIKNVPKLAYMTLQVWRNDSTVREHIDDNAVTMVILLHSDDNKGCYLKINNKKHDFKDYEIFCFNGTLPHELQNLSGSDVTGLILRIRFNDYKVVG